VASVSETEAATLKDCKVAKKVSSKTKAGSGKASRPKKAKKAKKAVKKTAKKAAAKKSVKKKTKKAAKKAVKKRAKKPSQAKKLTKSPLTKSELAHFRTILLQKRRDLVGDMTGIEAEALKKGRQDVSSDLSTLPTHPADIGTDNYEQEFTLGLLESERILLDKINAALQRIEKGTFGICLGTGKPISKARLEARPWTRYCIEYARMIEKGLVKPAEESPFSQQADEKDSERKSDGKAGQAEQEGYDNDEEEQ